VPAPLGETDLEPEGVEVEAKSEETDAFEFRYGRVDTEDAIDCVSAPLIFGSLKGEGGMVDSGGSKGGALLRGVMKTRA
jgi:hypothetical protein